MYILLAIFVFVSVGFAYCNIKKINDLPFIKIPFTRLVPLRNIVYYLEYESTIDFIKTQFIL